jgi:hypothetical protein
VKDRIAGRSFEWQNPDAVPSQMIESKGGALSELNLLHLYPADYLMINDSILGSMGLT